MATIGFIGLGVMGSPMAINLARAGHTVGYNRTPSKTAALVEAGGRAADSIADAVASDDLVALNLPDSPTSSRSSPATTASSRTRHPAR